MQEPLLTLVLIGQRPGFRGVSAFQLLRSHLAIARVHLGPVELLQPGALLGLMPLEGLQLKGIATPVTGFVIESIDPPEELS